jgi:hypothetical protein
MSNYTRLYATADGAWGVINEEEFAIVNCSMWTSEDFQEMDNACDSEKLTTALAITDRITKEILEDVTI